MRKWALILSALSVALVGCELNGRGDGGAGGGGGGGGGVTLSSANTTLLNTPGRIETTYNTGQGRAPGSPTAVVNRVRFVDDVFPVGDTRNNVETLLTPPRNLLLDGYSSQLVAVNAPMTNLGFSGPLNGRLFDTFRLDVDHLLIELAGGGFQTVNGPGGQAAVFELFDANVLALAGRMTSIQIFLDDAMLNFDGTDIVFDRALFEAANLTDDGNGNMIIMGHIGDYIAFDISSVASKPTMTNSAAATMVWFSGDGIALSGDVGTGAEYMEVLTPLSPPIEGLFNPPAPLPGGSAPGTYTLRQVDPRDLSSLARITALTGTWKPYVDSNPAKSPFLNLGTLEAFAFPQSLDDTKFDLVVVSRSLGGTITNMYFGQANLDTNTFSIWPIAQVDDGDGANEVSGFISGLLDRNGSTPASARHARSGNLTITAGGVPSGFTTTMRFIVYRL